MYELLLKTANQIAVSSLLGHIQPIGLQLVTGCDVAMATLTLFNERRY